MSDEISLVDLLMFAAEDGLVHKVKNLLIRGVDINAQDDEGDTALIIAARLGHIHLFDFLLSKNADPNLANNLGNTSLHHAFPGLSDCPIITSLLKAGANVNAINKEGKNTFLIRVEGVDQDEGDFSQALLVLMDHHADVLVKNQQGQTAASLVLDNPHKFHGDFHRQINARLQSILTKEVICDHLSPDLGKICQARKI